MGRPRQAFASLDMCEAWPKSARIGRTWAEPRLPKQLWSTFGITWRAAESLGVTFGDMRVTFWQRSGNFILSAVPRLFRDDVAPASSVMCRSRPLSSSRRHERRWRTGLTAAHAHPGPLRCACADTRIWKGSGVLGVGVSAARCPPTGKGSAARRRPAAWLCVACWRRRVAPRCPSTFEAVCRRGARLRVGALASARLGRQRFAVPLARVAGVRFQRVFQDLPRAAEGFQGLLGPSMGFQDLPMASKDVHGPPETLKGLSMAFRDLPQGAQEHLEGFPNSFMRPSACQAITQAFQGAPRASMGLPGPPRIFQTHS